MPENLYVNIVECDGETLIDLTQDTIQPDKLSTGYTAHDSTGAPIVGIAGFPHDDSIEGTSVQNYGTFKSLEVHGGTSTVSYNMFNRDWEIFGSWIGKTGTMTQDNMSCYTEPIPVVGGGSYRFSFIAKVTNNKRLHAYDSNGDWLYQVCEFLNTVVDRKYTQSFTLRADVAYLKFSYRPQDIEILLCEGTADRPFTQYGGIRILDCSPAGVQKGSIDIDLNGFTLESNGSDKDVLLIEDDGTCTIYPMDGKTAPTLSPIQLPSIDLADILYGVAEVSPNLVLTYIIGTGIVPTGTLTITENGTYDITNYANVVINVQE